MPTRKYTPDQLVRIVELREAGATYDEIAAEVGVTGTTAMHVCMREGAVAPADRGRRPTVPAEPRVERRGDHVVRRFTAAEDARLLELEAQGLSIRAIARALDRRPHSVRGRLSTLARHDAWAEAATE